MYTAIIKFTIQPAWITFFSDIVEEVKIQLIEITISNAASENIFNPSITFSLCGFIIDMYAIIVDPVHDINTIYNFGQLFNNTNSTIKIPRLIRNTG